MAGRLPKRSLKKLSSPDGFCDPSALLPPVTGQPADQVGIVQAAAEHAAHRTEQQELAVVRGRVAQRSPDLLHDLWAETSVQSSEYPRASAERKHRPDPRKALDQTKAFRHHAQCKQKDHLGG